MREGNQDLDYPRPDLVFRVELLERVDTILHAAAGRLRELAREVTPHGRETVHTTWPVEEMRLSPLGQSLLLIADSARGRHILSSPIEQALERVKRTLFGDPLSEGYAIPDQFSATDLGQLFSEATTRVYGPEDLMKPKEVYRELGISRQSVYDRVASDKLHPVYSSSGEMRFLRSEVEVWKAQRQRRKGPQ